MSEPSFTALPDLAARALGGSVIDANDETFAERQNLINAGPAVFSAHTFGHKGKIYDGWETRRRRESGHDYAIVRLGAAGIVRGVIIDTSWFRGNFPPFAAVEATSVEGYPGPDELAAATWQTIVQHSPLLGDSENAFAVTASERFTHVRLNIYPDGGVARLRVHGEVIADPRMLPSSLDLAARENGGRISGCSNMFYSSAANLTMPGPARNMGEGWENSRRRDGGNDYVEFELAAPGVLRFADLDTRYFLGNAPGWIALSGRTKSIDPWAELLPRTAIQPDTLHRFLLSTEVECSHVRLDVFPDGGLSRVRLIGELPPAVRAAMRLRWFNSLPAADAISRLVGRGMVEVDARTLVESRPLIGSDELPPESGL